MKSTDIKSYPWYIRVDNFTAPAVRKWLYSMGYKAIPDWRGIRGYTNTLEDSSEVEHEVFWMAGENCNPARHEIKIDFEIAIKQVHYPQLMSEQEIKIQELEETIKKAQEQIQELKKSA